MTGRHGPAFTFWLNYLEHSGGLWEQAGDTVLAILPDPLVSRHDLPESALITDDPDIAREDGALFLGAGHPEIDRGAETVIEAGDVGVHRLAHGSKQISTDDLLAKIRDQVPVAHGRIDATGSVLRSHRSQLRLGALVSHTVSADEQFTEVAQCVLDVPSRVAWAPDAADRLLRALDTADATGVADIRTGTLVRVVTAAHQTLDAAAAERGRELSNAADAERVAELARATEYYAAALAAIDKRRSSTDAQRQVLLDARADATRGERDRRLAEINEKYRHQHVLQPYRLHLLDVPVWRLATDVRRGDRRWPMVFDYLPMLGTVAPSRCPTCDAHSALVATKTHLGCTTCVPARSTPPVRPAPAPTPPASTPRVATSAARNGSTAKPVPPKSTVTPKSPVTPKTTVTPRSTASSKTTVAPKSTVTPTTSGPKQPFQLGRPEERKVVDFWNHVGGGDTRRVSRPVAADSPLAALIRLYGAAGPLYGIGVPTGHTPIAFTSGHYDKPVSGDRPGTTGSLRTHHGEHPYLLLWSPDKLLEEVLPYSMPWHPGRVSRFLVPITETPKPPTELDLVAKLLLNRVKRKHGLTFAARTLAAWWRLPDPDAMLDRFPARVLAATVNRAVRYWSGASEAGYADSAAMFTADEAEMRKATPVLQRHLQLSVTRNW